MSPATDQQAEWFSHWFNALLDNVELVIKGKRDQIALALVCVFSEGHLLLDDVPGTGKTRSPRRSPTRSRARGAASSSRPTCCPSDVTGGLGLQPAAAARSTSAAAPCSPTSCWPTRSTGPRRRRRRRCSR